MNMRTVLAAVIFGWLGTAAAMGQAAATMPTSTTAQQRAASRVEHHIADLHQRLAITPAQQAEWDAFAEIMRENAQRMEANWSERESHLAGMTAVEDMRSYATLERIRAEDMARLLPAFEALYATMSPDQRGTADRTIRAFQQAQAKRAHG